MALQAQTKERHLFNEVERLQEEIKNIHRQKQVTIEQETQIIRSKVSEQLISATKEMQSMAEVIGQLKSK